MFIVNFLSKNRIKIVILLIFTGIKSSLMVRMKGLEPSRREAPDPKSGVSANFTTSALAIKWYALKDSNLWPTP